MTKQKLPTSAAPVDAAATSPSAAPDNLIPDPVVCAEFGVTAMTLWRWTLRYRAELPAGYRHQEPKFPFPEAAC